MSLPAARTWISIPVLLAISAVAVYYMRLGPAAQTTGPHFEQIMAPGDYRFPGTDTALRREYTGFAPLDIGLTFLVAAFYPGMRGAGMSGAFEQQQPYFLMQFGPIIAAMAVEAGRHRNYLTLMSFTSIWALLYQTIGGAIIMPLWFAFYLWTTSRVGYWQKPHTMSAASAQGLFIAYWIGYIIPTVAMYLPGLDADTRQALVAIWQFSPLYVDLLWGVLARFLPSSNVERPKEEFADPTYWTKFLHSSALITSMIFHWIMIFNCLFSSNANVTFFNVLVPQFKDQYTMAEALLFIFQIDFWLIMAAGFLWAYISIGDLFELGMTNIDAAMGGTLIFLMSNIIGPGAAISLVCIWREDRLRAAASKKDEKKAT